MAYKAAAPCSVYREHLGLNPGSYSTSASADSDDFRTNAITEGLPAILGHVHDNTAYSTQPTKDNWLEWLAKGNQV